MVHASLGSDACNLGRNEGRSVLLLLFSSQVLHLQIGTAGRAQAWPSLPRRYDRCGHETLMGVDIGTGSMIIIYDE